MRPLNLSKKTGFRVLNPSVPVIIRDKRGILFYSTESMLPRVKWFNLPAGEYLVDKGGIVSTKYPRKYKMINLPNPQRLMKSPRNFQVVFASNPNKCTVSWSLNRITFDNSFKEKSLPIMDFILFHEFGHQYYGCPDGSTPEQKEFSERCCDMFASNMMKSKGYNPNQIGRALVYSLSERQAGRKANIVKQLIKAL